MSNLAERIAQVTKTVFENNRAKLTKDEEKLNKWRDFEGRHCLVYIINNVNSRWTEIEENLDKAPGNRKVIGINLTDFKTEELKFLTQISLETNQIVINLLNEHYNNLIRFTRIVYSNDRISARIVRI